LRDETPTRWLDPG